MPDANERDLILRTVFAEALFVPRLAGPRDVVIRRMGELMLGPDVGPDVVGRAVAAILAREAAQTTGIGEGLAVPHAAVSGVGRHYCGWASFDPPIDWQAIDGRATSTACFIVGPRRRPGERARSLGGLWRLMADGAFRAAVHRAGREAADAGAYGAAVVAAAREAGRWF